VWPGAAHRLKICLSSTSFILRVLGVQSSSTVTPCRWREASITAWPRTGVAPSAPLVDAPPLSGVELCAWALHSWRAELGSCGWAGRLRSCAETRGTMAARMSGVAGVQVV
jgi:hypothetical protein